jgi:hypothetical protein
MILVIAFAASAFAAGPKPFRVMTEGELSVALRAIHAERPGMSERIEAISERFLGTPYRRGLLGEGDDGEFDRDPLYSFAGADCTTFVEEVMALSETGDLREALDGTLRKIRYKDGRVAFVSRNHFTDLDWVPNNVAAGYLRDITAAVAGPRTLTVEKVISKRRWYAQMSEANIEGRFTPEERRDRLPKLRELGQTMPDETARLPVLPIAALADALPRIPSGTIANLVRDGRPEFPTMVSHQILLIKKGDQTFVRHAASGKEVMDVPVGEFFRRYEGLPWRLVGLNLNEIRRPGAPSRMSEAR